MNDRNEKIHETVGISGFGAEKVKSIAENVLAMDLHFVAKRGVMGSAHHSQVNLRTPDYVDYRAMSPRNLFLHIRKVLLI